MFKVYFITFGCKVNHYETECMKSLFRERGAEILPKQDGADAVLNVLRGRVCGQGMPVGYKEEASVQILKLDEACHCTVVVSKVKVTCGAYAAENCFHFYF